MKILVIQQKMIGDVLTSSILFEALRHKYPKAQLHYLINEHTYPVVENNPFIDQFIFFTKQEESSKKALFQFAKRLQSEQYDVLIDVYSKISSNIISAFSKAKTKISYHKAYSTFLYDYNIKRENKAHDGNLAITHRLQLLQPLGIITSSISPKIYLTEEELSNSKQFLEENGINLTRPLFMISVLGSGDNKTYPFEYMAQVIDTVVSEKPQAQLLFNYIPNQEKDARAIYELCAPETQKQIYFEVFGKSLRQFIAITKHCEALIGNEGGAINMAKALQIKTFAIFSPWIDKNTWSLFENENHESVHLKDFKTEIYNQEEKKFKAQSEVLYKLFKPELFERKLRTFLN
ncbi:glycosyltransferase family 9 protein [Tamlana haliotis]|uniref:Glycosyltransferase family 9 protein n=1 Tax=Pseudotamlana haliotis TaxID=2614804 RepID=A0A6N6MGH6_9FLAO|nr:glycosyltransferase family 9 protein [Tamlana haliotis]KAB1067244.1 glycosyltransferase family 9 protein [Tamlana haliotis]